MLLAPLTTAASGAGHEAITHVLGGKATRAFVYDADEESILQVVCDHFDGKASDYDRGCAIAAAKRAYRNVAS